MKDKIRSIVNHPAAGLVTIVAINTAVVVASVVAQKKLLGKKDVEV